MTEGSVGAEVAPPRIPASAGALVWDRKGRLLILKPTYKSGWTMPGGVVEADGETPWQACLRETREECGLELRHGRLVCVDFLRPRPGRPGGMRFLFGCGALDKSPSPASCYGRRRSPSTGWSG
jgi:8-oxo-dGTP diphosphatase